MILRRDESWGWLSYDTKTHEFAYKHSGDSTELPYASKPVVLNCDLTLRCNMACRHCVARDMTRFADGDLQVTPSLVRQINKSPFMVVVVTGGEPLLPDREAALLRLVNGLSRKGIVVDTNGTIAPSSRLLKALSKKNVLLRVSMDSVSPQEEALLRRAKTRSETEEAYFRKLQLIPKLKREGLRIAVQAVLHRKNLESIMGLPEKISDWGLGRLDIQRLIPTRRLGRNEAFELSADEYESALGALQQECQRFSITCSTKKDRRHNSVFLMVDAGRIFTQSERLGEKLYLGTIGSLREYFEYVSASEHSARYYDVPRRAARRGGRRRNRRGKA